MMTNMYYYHKCRIGALDKQNVTLRGCSQIITEKAVLTNDRFNNLANCRVEHNVADNNTYNLHLYRHDTRGLSLQP